MRYASHALALLLSSVLLVPIAKATESIFPVITLEPNQVINPFFFLHLDDPIPSYVENWVKLSIDGEMNHPFPMIWLSTQKFERRFSQRMIVLPPDGYRNFVGFAQSYSCPKLTGRLPDVLVIREFSAGEVREVCALAPKNGCEFVAKIRMLPNIDWDKVDSESIAGLQGEICNLIEHPVSGDAP